MKKPKKINMPKEHPKPFQSELWPHLEEIREMRRARKMWTEIAEHLAKNRNVTVSYRTIRNFFIRTRSPKRRIPAGFEEALGVTPKAPSSGPAQLASSPQPPSTPRTSEAANAVPQAPDNPKTKMTPEEAEAEFKRRAEMQRQQRPGFTLLEDDDKS